jgi:HSP20 family protein
VAEPAKFPGKAERAATTPGKSTPFESLRREINRLFDHISGGFWRPSSARAAFDLRPGTSAAIFAVDVSDTDKANEVAGIDEKNVAVTVVDGILTLRGEKQNDKQGKKNDYYLCRRNNDSFQHPFQVPQGIDSDKIEANLKNGVLSAVPPEEA